MFKVYVCKNQQILLQIKVIVMAELCAALHSYTDLTYVRTLVFIWNCAFASW